MAVWRGAMEFEFCGPSSLLTLVYETQNSENKRFGWHMAVFEDVARMFRAC